MLGSLQAVRSLHFPLSLSLLCFSMSLSFFLCASIIDILFACFLNGMESDDKCFVLHNANSSDELNRSIHLPFRPFVSHNTELFGCNIFYKSLQTLCQQHLNAFIT